jgi:hypothetical protein
VKFGPDTTTPSISIVPVATGTKPAIARSSVVLPQPELPTTQPISPRSSSERQTLDDRRPAAVSDSQLIDR